MGETGEMYNDAVEHSKTKRASNRDFSSSLLKDKGINFESKNCGAHLIVSHNNKIADFWPGTGKFKVRGEADYFRGVKNLIKSLEA